MPPRAFGYDRMNGLDWQKAHKWARQVPLEDQLELAQSTLTAVENTLKVRMASGKVTKEEATRRFKTHRAIVGTLAKMYLLNQVSEEMMKDDYERNKLLQG